MPNKSILNAFTLKYTCTRAMVPSCSEYKYVIYCVSCEYNIERMEK